VSWHTIVPCTHGPTVERVDARSLFCSCAVQSHDGKTGVTPNMITYNCLSCVRVETRARLAKETEHLLKKMHNLYNAGKQEVPPNTISYNHCALDAYWRGVAIMCGLDRASLQAELLVNKRNDLHQTTKWADIQPNTMVTYCSLLRCYANTGSLLVGMNAVSE
jgi:hypothetical protein